MSNFEINRELRAYEGEKKLTEIAIEGQQRRMKDMLQGSMGEDMMAVLNGEKKIEISKYKKEKFRLISWFKRLLRKF